jgi:hypothetical protein
MATSHSLAEVKQMNCLDAQALTWTGSDLGMAHLILRFYEVLLGSYVPEKQAKSSRLV